MENRWPRTPMYQPVAPPYTVEYGGRFPPPRFPRIPSRHIRFSPDYNYRSQRPYHRIHHPSRTPTPHSRVSPSISRTQSTSVKLPPCPLENKPECKNEPPSLIQSPSSEVQQSATSQTEKYAPVIKPHPSMTQHPTLAIPLSENVSVESSSWTQSPTRRKPQSTQIIQPSGLSTSQVQPIASEIQLEPEPSTSGTQSGRPPEVEISLVDDDDDDDDVQVVTEVKSGIKREDVKPLIACVDLCDELDSPEEQLNRFQYNTATKILLPICGTHDEGCFIEALRQFKEALQNQMLDIKLPYELMNLLTKYLLFLGINYGAIGNNYIDEYLQLMEDILVLYCQVVSELILSPKEDKKKQNLQRIAARIKYLIARCLLYRLDSAIHCLFKVHLYPSEKEHCLMWTDIFVFFLRKARYRLKKSDLFRVFIAWQKFKTIRLPTDANIIDNLMCLRFNRSFNELKTIPQLKEVIGCMQNQTRYSFRDMLIRYWRWKEERGSDILADLEEPTIIDLPGRSDKQCFEYPTMSTSSSKGMDEVAKLFEDRRLGRSPDLTQLAMGKRSAIGFFPLLPYNIFDGDDVGEFPVQNIGRSFWDHFAALDITPKIVDIIEIKDEPAEVKDEPAEVPSTDATSISITSASTTGISISTSTTSSNDEEVTPTCVANQPAGKSDVVEEYSMPNTLVSHDDYKENTGELKENSPLGTNEDDCLYEKLNFENTSVELDEISRNSKDINNPSVSSDGEYVSIFDRRPTMDFWNTDCFNLSGSDDEENGFADNHKGGDKLKDVSDFSLDDKRTSNAADHVDNIAVADLALEQRQNSFITIGKSELDSKLEDKAGRNQSCPTVAASLSTNIEKPINGDDIKAYTPLLPNVYLTLSIQEESQRTESVTGNAEVMSHKPSVSQTDEPTEVTLQKSSNPVGFFNESDDDINFEDAPGISDDRRTNIVSLDTSTLPGKMRVKEIADNSVEMGYQTLEGPTYIGIGEASKPAGSVQQKKKSDIALKHRQNNSFFINVGKSEVINKLEGKKSGRSQNDSAMVTNDKANLQKTNNNKASATVCLDKSSKLKENPHPKSTTENVKTSRKANESEKIKPFGVTPIKSSRHCNAVGFFYESDDDDRNLEHTPVICKNASQNSEGAHVDGLMGIPRIGGPFKPSIGNTDKCVSLFDKCSSFYSLFGDDSFGFGGSDDDESALENIPTSPDKIKAQVDNILEKMSEINLERNEEDHINQAIFPADCIDNAETEETSAAADLKKILDNITFASEQRKRNISKPENSKQNQEGKTEIETTATEMSQLTEKYSEKISVGGNVKLPAEDDDKLEVSKSPKIHTVLANRSGADVLEKSMRMSSKSNRSQKHQSRHRQDGKSPVRSKRRIVQNDDSTRSSKTLVCEKLVKLNNTKTAVEKTSEMSTTGSNENSELEPAKDCESLHLTGLTAFPDKVKLSENIKQSGATRDICIKETLQDLSSTKPITGNDTLNNRAVRPWEIVDNKDREAGNVSVMAKANGSPKQDNSQDQVVSLRQKVPKLPPGRTLHTRAYKRSDIKHKDNRSNQQASAVNTFPMSGVGKDCSISDINPSLYDTDQYISMNEHSTSLEDDLEKAMEREQGLENSYANVEACCPEKSTEGVLPSSALPVDLEESQDYLENPNSAQKASSLSSGKDTPSVVIPDKAGASSWRRNMSSPESIPIETDPFTYSTSFSETTTFSMSVDIQSLRLDVETDETRSVSEVVNEICCEWSEPEDDDAPVTERYQTGLDLTANIPITEVPASASNLEKPSIAILYENLVKEVQAEDTNSADALESLRSRSALDVDVAARSFQPQSFLPAIDGESVDNQAPPYVTVLDTPEAKEETVRFPRSQSCSPANNSLGSTGDMISPKNKINNMKDSHVSQPSLVSNVKPGHLPPFQTYQRGAAVCRAEPYLKNCWIPSHRTSYKS